MKYKELIEFDPITEVVKFQNTGKLDYQKNLVKTFVFSDAFKSQIIPLAIRNLDFTQQGESFGLQVVGNYGTGKSHMMSLLSLIAEDSLLVDLVGDEEPKKQLSQIAGKFKVLRFELGNSESLWEILTYKIESQFRSLDIDFSFEGHGPLTYAEKLQLMMAAFEDKYPSMGFLVVIDEMLAYLKGRGTHDKLNSDLQVLQAFGQACDGSRFKFMFGVQELIYQSTEFQFAAEMLNKVNDRYKDIIITKEDVAFIVKKRLLKKTDHQKLSIKQHLEPFTRYFMDMHSRIEEYIELFPVHPSYFENFEKIKIGKSQREILKTLSNQFATILDDDIPSDNPGLLTYDRYWEDIKGNTDLMSLPDVRRVKGITDLISDKITSYFTGARASKANVASRITNSCAIKILQHDLTTQNGSNVEHLVDDLCITSHLADDRDFLKDIVSSTANQLITATSGQYFDKNEENEEYHLRIEGGVNFDQKIKDYASTMPDANKDSAFFNFLKINLPLDGATYRSGFSIWAHDLDWKSHKTYRDGYIFFGNPNEKSTTQPKQHFYMYFMPIFDHSKMQRNNDSDEVYFVMEDLSSEFKDTITLYGAAQALERSADSTQKPIYRLKMDEINKKARSIFNDEYFSITKVFYEGKENPLSGYMTPVEGTTKERVFSDVASQVLEKWFLDESPHYPSFNFLNSTLSKENFDKLIKQALSKLNDTQTSNRDGEGILAGLKLWTPQGLDFTTSLYANTILEKLKSKGEGQVLNRDEILKCVHVETQLWLSVDHNIEADLIFVVLAALAALGELEISVRSDMLINASSLYHLQSCKKEDYYLFNHVKTPKGINYATLKHLFVTLLGKDLSSRLNDPGTYTELNAKSRDWAGRAAKLAASLFNGKQINGVEIISQEQGKKYSDEIELFRRLCDKLGTYTSEAKIKNFAYSLDDLKRILSTSSLIEEIESQISTAENLRGSIAYLQSALQYITDQNLHSEISEAIQKMRDVVSSEDENIKIKYQSELDKLKSKYATWYYELYLTYRISESDNTQKVALLDSLDMQVCRELNNSEFIPSSDYLALLRAIGTLEVAKSDIDKNSVLDTPYVDNFNPKDYLNSDPHPVSDLKDRLHEVRSNWEQQFKEALEDPIVKKNFDLIDPSKQSLLKDFSDSEAFLEPTNVISIRKTIDELHEGLKKIVISKDDLANIMSRPMSPEEAVDKIRDYIDSLTVGHDKSKVRIIVK